MGCFSIASLLKEEFRHKTKLVILLTFYCISLKVSKCSLLVEKPHGDQILKQNSSRSYLIANSTGATGNLSLDLIHRHETRCKPFELIAGQLCNRNGVSTEKIISPDVEMVKTKRKDAPNQANRGLATDVADKDLYTFLTNFLVELTQDSGIVENRQARPKRDALDDDVEMLGNPANDTHKEQRSARVHRESPTSNTAGQPQIIGSIWPNSATHLKMVSPEQTVESSSRKRRNNSTTTDINHQESRKQPLTSSPLGLSDSLDDVEFTTEGLSFDEASQPESQTLSDSAFVDSPEPTRFSDEAQYKPTDSMDNYQEGFKQNRKRRYNKGARRELANLIAGTDLQSPSASLPAPVSSQEHVPFRSNKNQPASYLDESAHISSHEGDGISQYSDHQVLNDSDKRNEQVDERHRGGTAKLQRAPALSQQMALDILTKHYRTPEALNTISSSSGDQYVSPIRGADLEDFYKSPVNAVKSNAPYASMDEHQLKQLLSRQTNQNPQLDHARLKQPNEPSIINLTTQQQQQALRTRHSPVSSSAELNNNNNIEDIFYNSKQSSPRRPPRAHKSSLTELGGGRQVGTQSGAIKVGSSAFSGSGSTSSSNNNLLVPAPSLANAHFIAHMPRVPSSSSQYTTRSNEPMLDAYSESPYYIPSGASSIPGSQSQVLGLIRASPLTGGLSSLSAAQYLYSPTNSLRQASPSLSNQQANKLQNPYLPLAYSPPTLSSMMPFASASNRYTRTLLSSQMGPHKNPTTPHRIGRVADSGTNYDDGGAQTSPSSSNSASSDPMWSDTQNQQEDYQQSPQTIQITAVPNGLGLNNLNGLNGFNGLNGWGGWGGPWNGRQVLLVNRQPQAGSEWRQWILPVAAILALPLVLGALFVPVFLKSVMFLIQILQMLGLLMPPAQLAGHLANSSIGSSSG